MNGIELAPLTARVIADKSDFNRGMADVVKTSKDTQGKIDKNMKDIEQSTDSAGKSFQGLGAKLKKSLSTESISKFGEKVKDMGKAVSDTGKKISKLELGGMAAGLGIGVKAAKDFADAQTNLQVKTGATKKETQEMAEVAKEAYTGVYADSAKEASDAVATIRKNVGDLNKADLKNVTNTMLTMEQAGSDLDENTRGLSQLMKSFGLDAQEAMDLMAAGFQNGLDNSHELGDNLAEYAPLWSQYGFSAKEMFNILQAGTDGTSYNLDKVNDLIKEMGISLNDGRMDENMDKFSASTQKAFISYKETGKGANDVIKGMINDLDSMKNKQEAASLASTMWSALGEDNALKVIGSMNKVNKKYDDVKGKSKEVADANGNDFTKLQQSMRELQTALIPVGTSLAKALLPLAEKLQDLIKWWDKADKKTKDQIKTIAGLTATVGPAVIILGKLTSSVGSLIKGFSSTVEGVKKFSKGMKEFVKNTKDGQNWVGKLGSKIGDLAKGATKKGMDAVKKGMSAIGEGAKKATQKIGDVAKKLASFASGVAKKGMDAAKNGLSTIKDKAKDAGKKAGEVASQLKSFASEKVSKGINSVKKGLSDIKDKGKAAATKIADISTKVKEWSSEKVKAAFSSMKKNLTQVKDKAKDASTKVAGVFKAATSKTKKFFTNLISSLGTLISKSTLASKLISGLSTAFTLMTGPVGIAVGAIALIGGAFVLAYKKCKPFRDFINNIGKWFKEKFDGAIKKVKGFAKDFVKGMVDSSLNPVSVAVKGWKIAKYFKNRFDASMEETGSFSKSIKNAFSDTVSKIGKTVRNWDIVKKFTDKWDSTKEKTSNFISDMKKGISDMITNIIDTVKNSKIGKAFGDAFDKAKELVAKPVNAIIDGANWVLDKLGSDTQIKHWKYAKGTPQGGHPGGLAMINDGAGPHFEEAVRLPNGRMFIAKGRDVVLPLPKGSEVMDGENTHYALKTGLLHRYAKGTEGGFFSNMIKAGKRFVGKAVDKLGDVVGDVMDFMDDPKSLVQKVLDNVVDLSGMVKFPLDTSKAVVIKAKDALVNKVKGLFESMVSADGAGLSSDVNANGVYQYLVNIAKDVISKFGGTITSGYRPGSRNETGALDDHSQRQAIDISGVGYGTYEKMKKYVVSKYKNRGLKYVIANNTWATKSGGWKWGRYPYGAHTDHMHLSGLKPGGKIYKSSGKGIGVKGVNAWKPYVIKALKANGLPTSSAYVNAWLRQIQTESGGNEKAMGGDDGLSDGRAMGLLQVKPPTFAANKHAGHNNIMNGYDNMLAAMRYAKRRYGSSGMLSVIGHGHGYSKGTSSFNSLFKAIVNDGSGRELIREGNKLFLPKGRDRVLSLRPGSEIFTAQQTSNILSRINRSVPWNGYNARLREDELVADLNHDSQTVDLTDITRLLEQLVNKDTRFIMNNREVAKATADETDKILKQRDYTQMRLQGGY